MLSAAEMLRLSPFSPFADKVIIPRLYDLLHFPNGVLHCTLDFSHDTFLGL
jgi:hypothetical protein